MTMPSTHPVFKQTGAPHPLPCPVPLPVPDHDPQPHPPHPPPHQEVVIRLTVAIALPELPSASTKVKVNEPFAVKLYVKDPPLFVTVIDSPLHASVANTGHAVDVVIE